MFCSREINKKIDHIHERALRLVYKDYLSTFSDLLKRDKSISIHHRNIHQVAIEMHKAKNDSSPQGKTVNKGIYSLRNFGPVVQIEILC